MSSGYDGSIKIDTTFDSGSFNDAMKRLSLSIKGAFTGILSGVHTATAGISKFSTTVRTAMAGVASKILSTATNVTYLAANFANVAQFVWRVVSAAVQMGFEIITAMSKASNLTTDYGKEILDVSRAFANLKGALYAAFAPLITFALPYIKIIINWLTRMLNIIAQVVAALLGQKTVMQYVEGSADSAATSTGRLAGNAEKAAKGTKKIKDNTDKAAKAAKGALATFDELNVLQQDTAEKLAEVTPETPEEPGAGGVSAGGAMLFKEVPISDEALVMAEKIREKAEWINDNVINPLRNVLAFALEVFNKITGKDVATSFSKNENVVGKKESLAGPQTYENFMEENARKANENFHKVWDPTSKWLDDNVWQPMKKDAELAWSNIQTNWGTAIDYLETDIWPPMKKGFEDAWSNIQTSWSTGKDWLNTNVWEPMKTDAGLALSGIQTSWDTAVNYLETDVLPPMQEGFEKSWSGFKEGWGKAIDFMETDIWPPLKQGFTDAWTNIQTAWSTASTWFTDNVGEPIRKAFETALNWIDEHWKSIFDSIKDFVKNSINTIIDFINSMLSAMAKGLNGAINNLNAIKVTVPKWVPEIGDKTWSMAIPTVSAPTIPHLATGAVIPPNSQFAAILGDQRSGTNIESPVGLMRQVVNEAMESHQVNREIVIRFEGTGADIARLLKPYIDQENRRIGKSLVVGNF